MSNYQILAFLALLASFQAPVVRAQSFVEVAAEQGIFHHTVGSDYGSGVSFYDVNHDGWDDLTVCGNGQDVKLYLNDHGNFLPPIVVAPNTLDAKMAIWVDFDNDGDADLFVTRKNGPWSLYRNDGDLANLVDVTEAAGLPSTTSFETYGASWADFNRDGHLDIYICNYNIDGVTNFLFMSNGDGTFYNYTLESGASDGSKTSFIGLLTDYNHDLWPDIFVVNDRLNFSNTLFRNNGGTFTNVTAQNGLNDAFFTMNASTADYDHSGRLAIYCTNNPTGNRLYRQNEDFTYQNVAAAANTTVMDHTWSALWVDANLDGFEDLHVACSPFWNQPGQNRFFMNTTNGTFTNSTTESGFVTDKGASYSTAAGDFNNDGHFDLFVLNGAPHMSRLWKCVPDPQNLNRYLKVRLEGVASNRDGIGAWIYLYSGGMTQMRYTYCGEGYLTQNSQNEIFGTALAETADSLIVMWPSGHVDAFYNLPTNQTYHFVEGQSISLPITAQSLLWCPGDSIWLASPSETPVLWSTNAVATEIWVHEPGEYAFIQYNAFNVPLHSETITIEEMPQINAFIQTVSPSCFGEASGVIFAEDYAQLTDISITIGDQTSQGVFDQLHAGIYFVHLSADGYCDASVDIELDDVPEMEALVLFDPVLCFGGTTQVSGMAFGANGEVSIDWGGITTEAVPDGLYTAVFTDQAGCTSSVNYEVKEPDELLVFSIIFDGLLSAYAEGGTPPYSFIWTAHDGTQASGEICPHEFNGNYTLQVTDANGCTNQAQGSLTSVNQTLSTQNTLHLKPNPVTRNLTISLNTTNEDVSVDIFTIGGRKVFQGRFNSFQSHIVIDLDHLTGGAYLLHLIPDRSTPHVARFIKSD